MVTRSVKRRRLVTLAVTALSFAALIGALIAYKASIARTENFQELADNAAIAGVDALVKTEGLPDAVRMEVARIAASNVVASKEPAATVLAPTTDGMTMSVTLTKNASGKGSAVTAKARYVEPGGSVADDKREDVRRSLIKPERG